MKKVREGLFIGSVEDAERTLCGAEQGVTHILSLEKVRKLSVVKREMKRRQEAPVSKLEQALRDHASRPSAASQDVKQELFAKPRAKPVRKIHLLKDVVEEDLLTPLEECLDFVDKGREDGVVLVHCGAGVSRSAAVVTAYLMRKEKLAREDALASLKECAPEVSPNDGFMQQLQTFQERLSRPD